MKCVELTRVTVLTTGAEREVGVEDCAGVAGLEVLAEETAVMAVGDPFQIAGKGCCGDETAEEAGAAELALDVGPVDRAALGDEVAEDHVLVVRVAGDEDIGLRRVEDGLDDVVVIGKVGLVGQAARECGAVAVTVEPGR
jgi:hypothetical protein